MSNESNNMEIWDRFKTTDPRYTKSFKRPGGFAGTAISPMSSIMRMTEKFGPCGSGWGFDVLDEKIISSPETAPHQAVIIKGHVWYLNENRERCYTAVSYGGDQLVQVKRDGSIRLDDEAFKKAATDCMSKCLSFLGIGADIHMGWYDDPQYAAFAQSEIRQQAEAKLHQQQPQQQQAPQGQQSQQPTQGQPQDQVPAEFLSRLNQTGLDGLEQAADWVRQSFTGAMQQAALNAIDQRKLTLSQ